MTVLRRGYVPVEPDTSGFDDKLREQLAKQDPGGKAGRQIGGQLNRSLKRLGLDPIDVKADPKKALAAIDAAEARLRELGGDAASLEIKIKTERALSQLQRFRKQVGDVGHESGMDYGSRLDRALRDLDLKPIDLQADPKSAFAAIKEIERRLQAMSRDSATVEIRVKTEKALSELGQFKRSLGDVGDEGGKGAAARFAAAFGSAVGSAPAVPVAGTVLGVAMAPTLAAALAGAVVGGAGLGGVVGGVVLAARDPEVKAAGTTLGRTLLSDLESRAGGFVDPVLRSIERIRTGFQGLGPDLDRIFDASRFVEPLTDAVIQGTQGVVHGVADAVDAADPIIDALRNSIISIGQSTGNLFTDLAQHADEGASAIDDLTLAITNAITVADTLTVTAAKVQGFGTQVDKILDKSRYWLEDNSSVAKSLNDIGVKLDLTADGFHAGSVQAEAYRKATLGTADATDFAILKAAGMTDAQIAAADASGKYRSQLDSATTAIGATATANERLVATDEDVKTATVAATTAQQDLTNTLNTFGGSAGRAGQLATALKTATQNLYGAQIAAADANEGYEASWDSLSESIAHNKSTLDVHTSAGRSNRDALKDLIGKTNDLYFAEIATGSSVASATKKHEDRIAAIKEEARRLGLNKDATQALINTYGKIPKKKETDLIVGKVDEVVKALKDLYIFQRSLADGIPVESERAKLNEKAGPAKRYGGYAQGGLYDGLLPGPASRVDNLTGVGPDGRTFGLAGGEYIVNARQTMRHRGLLEDLNAGRDGFDAGGYLAPVDTSTRWPFRADMSHTRVPSRSEAEKKVISAPPTGGPTDDWIVRVVRARFPHLNWISKFRPGAMTLTGNRSYHSMHRAVDWPANHDLAAWWNHTYKARTKELITPWNDLNVWNGRSHRYTGAVWNQHNFAGGNAHDHIAMAGGGLITEPIVGVGRSGTTYAFGERGVETVTPGTGGARTYSITVNVPVGAHPAEVGRQTVAAIQAYERANGTTWRR